MPDDDRFGEFGGRHVPEPLEAPLERLAATFDEIGDTDRFRERFRGYLRDFAGRPTPLFHAERLSEAYGAEIYLKREDLLHGGAHKINNCLGQAILAEEAGKSRLIAETGAGQHGVATAMVGALLDLDTEIYMGEKDAERQRMNVFRMRLLGATVNEVTRGGGGLADAVDAALEDFAGNVEDTHYLVGSAVGPDPFPRMVGEFQSVIGEEARDQVRERAGRLPDAAVACVGGGSNAIGLFHAFRGDDVEFYGAEGGGEGPDRHAAPLSKGTDGVLHGMKTRTLDDDTEVHSVSAGLDYPAVGPEHAMFRAIGRCDYRAIGDDAALEAFRELSELEGIIPALESSHALALTREIAAETDDEDEIIVVNLSGRGDKDMEQAAELFDLA